MADVLVVDDDPDIRAMVAFTLTLEGFSVREAIGGRHALELLEELEPACMVLDLVMGDLDGFEVLERMRGASLAPRTRVVVFSARTDDRSMVRAWRLGVEEYLVKPTDPATLAARVQELVGLPVPV